MANVQVYTTAVCPYCVQAKRLLVKKGIKFDEIDVSSDPGKRDWLVKTTGQRTVPQIFIDDVPYGGFSDIAELDRQGKLDTLLGVG
jgi:glutaredoxin 3